MEILYRNFTKLLSIGVFETDKSIEDMSEFKWNKLLNIAGTYKVKDHVCFGIVKSDNKQIPENIYRLAKNNISNKEESKATTNYKLIFNEIHSIDTSIDSLILLKKLIDNINNLLNRGVDINKLADLGKYLREYGDKIDFVKVESWIKILNIRNMCTLIGCMLIRLFSFEIDELPFIKQINDKFQQKTDKILKQNITLQPVLQQKINENSGQGINPISKPNTSPLKFFRYFPAETTCRFISNIMKSLSNIDE